MKYFESTNGQDLFVDPAEVEAVGAQTSHDPETHAIIYMRSGQYHYVKGSPESVREQAEEAELVQRKERLITADMS